MTKEELEKATGQELIDARNYCGVDGYYGDYLDNVNAEMLKRFNCLAKLEKENAELKSENQKWKDEWQEQVQKATDEGYARTLQTIQLSKAKDIIKNLMVYVPVDLKEYEEAKQFLSEVEK